MMLTPLARTGTRPAALTLVAVLAVIGLLPLTPTAQYLVATAMAWAVAAVGLDIFSGVLGQPSFGHAGFVGVGAYTYAILSGRAGLAPAVAALGAVAAAAVLGAVTGLALLRLREFGAILGTFFLAVAVTAALSGTTLASWTHAASGLQVIAPRLGSTDLGQGRGYYYLCTAVLLVAVIISCNYSASRSGHALRLVRRSETAAQALGARPQRTKLAAFTFSAALSGASGVLIAIGAGYIAPESFAVQQSIVLFAMAAVGGLGSIAGPILGALLITVTPNYLQGAQSYQDIIVAALLLTMLVLFPRGLFGLLLDPLLRTLHTHRPRRAARAGRTQDPRQGPGQDPVVIPAPAGTAPGATAGHTVLAVDGLTVSYGGVHALDRVALTVTSGTVHALVGPNGAGKTTLLNVISGLAAAQAGCVEVLGRPVTPGTPAARAGVARTFQNVALAGDLSVLDNVSLGVPRGGASGRTARLLPDLVRPRRAGERAARRAAADALGLVGIPPGRHHIPARDLSLAEAKMTDIARAVATGAPLLVMDEPTAGLSAPEMAAVSALIAALRAHRTIVVVSHHVGWVRDVAGTVTAPGRWHRPRLRPAPRGV